jgi:DNA-binding transcriptional MerR regulator
VTVTAIHAEEGHSAEYVCAETGITYRQLDYWLRKGYITMTNPVRGSGTHRRFTDDELEALRELMQRYTAAQREIAEIADGTAWAMIRAEQQMKGTSHDEPAVRGRHPSARRTG